MTAFVRALVLLLLGALTVRGQETPAPVQQQQESSRDLSLTEDRKARAAPSSIPRSYALVIGIAKYPNLSDRMQLQYSASDAEEIYSTLISQNGGQFPAENVHRLVNEQATLANIRKEVEEWLPSVSRDGDRVLIYFAGHGFLSKGKAYLGPYDLKLSNIEQTAYSMATLGQIFGDRIKGKWKVLLTDACHSGAITPATDPAQLNRSLLDVPPSLFSLTASRDREQSFEGKQWNGGHGVFTYFVVAGLQGEADESHDGVVTADELAEYVRENVRTATGARQNPTSDRGSFDPNMVLAFNPGRPTAESSKPLRLGTLVFETNMDGTEVWVDGNNRGTVNKGAQKRLPGIQPGEHQVKGVRSGYQPDGPRSITVYPGQETTVSFRVQIPQRRDPRAQEHIERGLDLYTRGGKQRYAQAVKEFNEASRLDPADSQIFLYLGRANRALFDDSTAEANFRKAIELDPADCETRTSFAALLLDTGDFDEAIRQLNFVTRRLPEDGTAWYLLSQAYVRKGTYNEARAAAERATRLAPQKAETYLWYGEALRMDGQCADAEPQYARYLDMSRFDHSALTMVAWNLFGGKIARASQADIWKELQTQAKVGLCDCQWLLHRPKEARDTCLAALALDKNDLFASYRLGVIESELYNETRSVAMLAAARKHFQNVVTLNPDLVEAQRARMYVANIDSLLQTMERK